MATNEKIEYQETRTDQSYRNWLYVNGEFSGNVKLVPIPSNVSRDLPPEYKDWLYLADLTVKPELQKRGFGSSLLEKALGFANEKNKSVLLVANPKGPNKPTIQELSQFYLKRGFKKLDVIYENCFGYRKNALSRKLPDISSE